MTTLLIPIHFSDHSPTSHCLAEPLGMLFIERPSPVEIKLYFLGPLAIDYMVASFADRSVDKNAIRGSLSMAIPLGSPF